MATFSLRGVDDMDRRLTEISRQTKDDLSDAAMNEAQDIARKAEERTPEKAGKLRKTIKVVKGQLSQGRSELGQFTSGSEIEIVIAAGDDTTPYALTVHEHPSQHDPPTWEGVQVTFHPEGTGPKFLERPLLDSVDGMANRVASRVEPRG